VKHLMERASDETMLQFNMGKGQAKAHEGLAN
jgi:hypothetical protein